MRQKCKCLPKKRKSESGISDFTIKIFDSPLRKSTKSNKPGSKKDERNSEVGRQSSGKSAVKGGSLAKRKSKAESKQTVQGEKNPEDQSSEKISIPDSRLQSKD